MRLLSLSSMAILFAASAASAQPRLIVTGELVTVEVSLETGATRPLNRPGGSVGGVAVDGGRYIVSVVRNAAGAPVVHAWAPKTGQFLATAPLPGTASDETPALAGDSLTARAFIWNQTTISTVTASGVTPLVTDVQPASSVSSLLPRLLAFAPVSRTLFVVRANAGVLELASFTDAGVPIQSTPLTGRPFALAVTSDGGAAFFWVAGAIGSPLEGRRYDPVTGALTHVVNVPSGFAPGRPHIALDESHERVTFTDARTGLYAFTFDLTPLNAFSFQQISPSGACRFDVAFDERNGAVVTATTAIPYPFTEVSRTPIVTALDVVTPAVIGSVALSPSPDATTGPVTPCGGGSILLTPPVVPTLEPAIVTGTTVTLSWDTVRNATNYRVEAAIGSGATILTTLTNNHTSLAVNNVPPGTYTVRVRGVNDSGLGVLSAPITVTVP